MIPIIVFLEHYQLCSTKKSDYIFCGVMCRLKNGTPVSYSEVELGKKSKVAVCDDEDLLGEVDSRPEIYTEKHEKLLGSTEKGWTLFVDGYGSDGKRIYDQVKGQTCHQCRSDCCCVCVLLFFLI